MNESRSAKGQQRLAASETLLRKSLLESLPQAVRHGTPLFTNSRYNPHLLPAHHLDPEAEALLDLASACLELREYLGFPATGSVGQLYLSACEEGASDDPHRRGPRKLAEALFAELRDEG